MNSSSVFYGTRKREDGQYEAIRVIYGSKDVTVVGPPRKRLYEAAADADSAPSRASADAGSEG